MTFVSLTLVSCNNDIENDLSKIQNTFDNKEFFTISYKGQTYKNIPVQYDKNGDFIFLDSDFARIYNEKINIGNYTMYLDKNSNISFYDNLDDFFKDKNLKIISDLKTRSGNEQSNTFAITTQYSGGVELYDDKNFLDTRKEFTLKIPDNYSLEISNLSSISFNDKCSSLRVTNNLPSNNFSYIVFGGYTYKSTNIIVLFVGNDDVAFQDRQIICAAEAGTICEHNELPGFNDKLSSFKLYLTQKGQYECSIDTSTNN